MYKSLSFSLLATLMVIGVSTAQAHDMHNVASDHHHPQHHYTHSVSSHYDNHHTKHHYGQTSHGYPRLKQTTNTATYYSRNYPTATTYTYYRPANTTIHQPPYAYSSCGNRCDDYGPTTMTVSQKSMGRTYTYPAPSEYNAQHRNIPTPRKVTNCHHSTPTTYTSPYKTHKLTTCTSYGCSY